MRNRPAFLPTFFEAARERAREAPAMARRLALLASLLIALQLSRAIFKAAVFQFADRTIAADAATSIAFMAAATAAMPVLARKAGIDMRIFPASFSAGYIASTLALLGLFVSTLLISAGSTTWNALVFAYNAVVTVVYEETLFRGLVYGCVERRSGEPCALAASALLFGLWHVGYVDTVIWRTSMFFPDADVFQIMLWKAATGLCLGVLLGAIRGKCGNVYPSMLAHAAINALGS